MNVKDLNELYYLQQAIYGSFDQKQATINFENRILELQMEQIEEGKRYLLLSQALKEVLEPFKRELSHWRTSNEKRLEIAKKLVNVKHEAFEFRLFSDNSWKMYINNIETWSACDVCHLDYGHIKTLVGYSNYNIKSAEYDIKNRDKIKKHFEKIRRSVDKELRRYSEVTQYLYDLRKY